MNSKKFIWEFTNKRKLTAAEFARYFESKVRKTIRKYQMPIGKIKKKNLKVNIINKIINDLPARSGKLSEGSLNSISNKIMYITMHSRFGDLKKLLPLNQPLYFLSDAEILLYAKIKKIKGKLQKETGKLCEIDNFIKIFEEKNPDIRQNIVEALLGAEK